jgi:hypothetical protein
MQVSIKGNVAYHDKTSHEDITKKVKLNVLQSILAKKQGKALQSLHDQTFTAAHFHQTTIMTRYIRCPTHTTTKI